MKKVERAVGACVSVLTKEQLEQEIIRQAEEIKHAKVIEQLDMFDDLGGDGQKFAPGVRPSIRSIELFDIWYLDRSYSSLRRIGPAELLDACKTEHDHRPEVWWMELRYVAADRKTEVKKTLYGIGWNRINPAYWDYDLDQSSRHWLVDLDWVKIPLSEKDPETILRFITKFRSAKEAILQEIIDFGIPALERSKSSLGGSSELAKLRFMMENTEEHFKNGINPKYKAKEGKATYC